MLLVQWTPEGGSQQSIDFDACVEQNYESPAEISDHMVESGAAITDFVRAGNDTFTIEAWASNTPVDVPTYGLDGAAWQPQSLSLKLDDGSSVSASTLQASSDFDRVTAIDTQLLALRDSGQLLTVFTKARRSENCVIQNYRRNVNAETANVLACVLTFRKLRIASTERTAAPAQTSNRANQSQRHRGSTPAGAAQPPTSVLSNLTGYR